MSAAQQKVVQYLQEAHASELALTRVLQSQIAMTPSGSYRSALEKHLEETHRHTTRVGDRIAALGGGANPVMAVIGFWEDALGQILALGKTPLDLLRGSGGEEKLLKNAKDTCATEALEVATYAALERVALAVDDRETATLAASIRAEEERMLDRVMREIPKLADAVVGADVNGHPSYDASTTGAADAGRDAVAATKRASRATKRAARPARKVPGVARAEGQLKGAVAGEGDLAISGYDALTAQEITDRLSGLSQIELAKTEAYERRHENRSTVLNRVSSLRGDEPWPGYDELTVAEIGSTLSDADEERAAQVRTYERAHKNRAGVLNATERDTATRA
jgi:ferritin-like metal-binding protein YciE